MVNITVLYTSYHQEIPNPNPIPRIAPRGYMHLRWRLCEKTIFTLGAWNPRKRRVVTIRTTCTLEKLFKKVFVIQRGNEEKDLLNQRCLSGRGERE